MCSSKPRPLFRGKTFVEISLPTNIKNIYPTKISCYTVRSVKLPCRCSSSFVTYIILFCDGLQLFPQHEVFPFDCPFHSSYFSSTDTACFVFGENIDVYNTTDPIHQEFIVAGLEFIKQISLLKPLPIYDYFPSLAYRKFIQATRRMRELGKKTVQIIILQCMP